MSTLVSRNACLSRRLFAALICCAACACASADREGAERLASAGSTAATVLSNEVDGRISEVRSLRLSNDFNYAYSILSKCDAITRGTSTVPDCDVLALAKERRAAPVNVEIEKLANVLVLRRRALGALSQAYLALETEAKYDARKDIEDSLAPALSSANAFASAVGLAPISGVVLKGVEVAGGLLADRAQGRRLKMASRSLGAITAQVRRGLEGEQRLHAEVDALLSTLDAQTRANLLRSGLIDPAPAVAAVVGTTDSPVPPSSTVSAALRSQPALEGAALVAAMSTPPSRPDALADGIAALRAVERQHDAFEAGAPVGIEEITDAVQRVTTILEAKED